MPQQPHTSALSLREHASRREWLRVGGLGSLGLSLGGLFQAQARAAVPNSGTFGKAKHCIILFLGGGPPQHESFDTFGKVFELGHGMGWEARTL